MKRTTGFFAFMTVAALVAAGCGGRDDSSSTATTASSGTTAASSATTGAATTAAEPTEATDIGITATEIHIGVVADVDTPLSPGLSQPLVSAVKAWGDQVNANGGLAGRKIVVTFYDSKLNPDEAVNAYTQACQSEFATVGSGAFVLLNPDPIQTCKDKAGNAIGLPDVAALTISAGAATSKSSYGIIQAGQDFTAAQPTFTITKYGWDYVYGTIGGIPNVNQIGIDPGVPGIGPGILAAGQALTEAGGKFAGKVVYPDAAPQSEATPIIQKIKNEGINSVASTSIGVAKLMAEARVQGLDMTKVVWTCTSQCQSPSFATQNAAAVEGLYISQLLTPFDETDVPGVKAYRAGVTDDANVSANGETAYAAALAFQDLVGKIVQKDGVNGLTRQSLLDLLATHPTVDTQGILDASEVLGQASDCWVTVQIQSGKFVRMDPQGTGKFECNPDAIVQVTGNFTG
jgi:ABC-type branched-subunit amino acid transport system substrate-binding protein